MQVINLNSALPGQTLDWMYTVVKFAEPGHFTQMVDQDANVYAPDGSLLFALRKRAIPWTVWQPCYRSVLRAARRCGPQDRKRASGGQNNFHSGALGYMPRVGLTSATGADENGWCAVQDLIRALDEVFRLECPEQYERHREAVGGTPDSALVPGTMFTTAQCNHTDTSRGKTARMAYHPDAGNTPGSFGVMSVLGRFDGGLLVFPKYEIAVEIERSDVLIANNLEWHGNTAIQDKRLSVVAFAHTSNAAPV